MFESDQNSNFILSKFYGVVHKWRHAILGKNPFSSRCFGPLKNDVTNF